MNRDYDDESEILEIKSLLPDTQYVNNTKVMNALVEGQNNSESYNVNVFKNIYTTVDISHDSRLSLSCDIDAYDKMIMDSVYSLLVSGNKAFTIEMVYRVLFGRLKDNINISSTEKSNIRNSINKMRHIDVTIQCSSEMEARKKKIYEITDYMLPLRKVSVKIGNNAIMEGWIFDSSRMPPLYRYAEMTGQLITIPTSLLRIKEKEKVYTRDIELKRYIIHRIEIMKHNDNIINEISYEWTDRDGNVHGLLNYLGIKIEKNENGKKLRQKICKKVASILDAFVAQSYISGYEPITKNRSIVKYNIIL